MTEAKPRFTRSSRQSRPARASAGFEVGVICIAWLVDGVPVVPVVVGHRLMYRAIVTSCWTDSGVLSRDAFTAALRGAVVVDPTGTPRIIRGVESPATVALYVGVEIGILLSAAEVG